MDQVRQNFTTALIFLLISSSFFVFDRLGTVTTLRDFLGIPFEFAQLPVIVLKTNITEKIKFVGNLAKIEKENTELSERLAKTLAENIRLQNLATENEALRAQIGAISGQTKSLPAKVIGISRFLILLPQTPNQAKVGSTVTLGNNFVGTVVEVGAKLVKIRLPQDPASSIPAVVTTPGGPVRGIVTGRYGKILILEKVEKQEVIPLGAAVQTTGEADITAGLVLGKVAKVEKADPAPFLEIEVESLVDFSKLTTVFIIGD